MTTHDTTTQRTVMPEVAEPAEWDRAREELLRAEKELTRAEDAVAALRRRLPMVPFRSDFRFAGPDGERTLLDLFEGRSQLVLYQFMDTGPDMLCPGCTWFTNGVPSHGLEVLAELDVSWVTVSDMPIEQMRRVWPEKGWTMPYASSRGTSFTDDIGVGGGFMLAVFLRDGDQIYRTYTTTQRGVDRLVFANVIQDLLPFGRKQDWEDSPAGWPQRPTYG
jgi:predicted dithiol-disulfide oxidoreductase (DUF899 family)